ncbi:hypothetical protein ABPG75_012502 [Micractinium tetrahymenae]
MHGVRSLLHIGIWWEWRAGQAAALSAQHMLRSWWAAERLVNSLCTGQEQWDHDLHFGRLGIESEEEGHCFPPSLERLCLRRLEASALPPGLAACSALRELQLDHVVLDGEPQQRFAALAALTAVAALGLDCVPAAVVPAELGSLSGLQRLSLRHAAGWHPESVRPAGTSLAHSFERLVACPSLTALTFVGELVLGLPPAQNAQLDRLAGLRRLSLLYDNARAGRLLSEEAVQACSCLSALHLGGTPTQPGVSLPLLALLLRRLQLGAPHLRQLTASCSGVEAGLRHILELEAAGGTGYELNELEPAGPWMQRLLQQAGGAAGVRAAEAAWLRRVWLAGSGPAEWLQPWQLPAWDAE